MNRLQTEQAELTQSVSRPRLAERQSWLAESGRRLCLAKQDMGRVWGFHAGPQRDGRPGCSFPRQHAPLGLGGLSRRGRSVAEVGPCSWGPSAPFPTTSWPQAGPLWAGAAPFAGSPLPHCPLWSESSVVCSCWEWFQNPIDWSMMFQFVSSTSPTPAVSWPGPRITAV